MKKRTVGKALAMGKPKSKVTDLKYYWIGQIKIKLLGHRLTFG